MLLFRKYTTDIPCSGERFRATLESKVCSCGMIRSVFPIDDANEPFVGTLRRDKVMLCCRETWGGGMHISRCLQPVLRGTIIGGGDTCCTFAYRFLPDPLLFPCMLLWLVGMLYLILQRSGRYYCLLPFVLLLPCMIMTPIYSICTARIEKQLKAVIQAACETDRCGS